MSARLLCQEFANTVDEGRGHLIVLTGLVQQNMNLHAAVQQLGTVLRGLHNLSSALGMLQVMVTSCDHCSATALR
jgi:hypothetical protein